MVSMISLYIKENCAYSAAVIHKFEEEGIKVKIKDIAQNKFAIELMEIGGKYQVPCLIDQERGICIYESNAIINYVDKYLVPKKN